jgi:pyruvate/2-oxoacid:ferredoxin oxidoreductase beta subunit/Pyruvate/2-oxoacid:ferredoxin oxidoreductase gamma subunit
VVGDLGIVGACQRPGGTLPSEKEVVQDLEYLSKEMQKKDFNKKFEDYRKLVGSERLWVVNRGDRFKRLALTDSSHAEEYAKGMEGKRPEPRKQESMTDKNVYYCSGCDHKHSTEALGTAFDSFKDFQVTLYSPVGCSIFLYDFFRKYRVNNVQVPHGRGPAAASASKRSKPDSLVICYQGDGDALDIGLGELMHAAARGEKITVILINNGTYGMTGGQLSATTPLDQFSKTTPKGREASSNGFPIDISELLHKRGVSYFRRTLLGTPELNQQFTHFLSQALLHQIKGDGMSVIEVIATCTEHQRAPQEIIAAFQAAGKKLHQIVLSKEYTSKTMTATFPTAVGWGEDFEDAEAVVRGALEARKKNEANTLTGPKRFESFVKALDSMGLIMKNTPLGSDHAKDMRFYLAGEGGQGVQSLADILMKLGVTRYAFNSPWYEPEVTKARTVAEVTLSNNLHVNPNPEIGEVDCLVCMTPQMYFEKKHFVKKGGLILVDGQGVDIKNGQYDYQIINVPATLLATSDVKERRSANIVMLGALNQALEIAKDEVIEKIIRANIPKAAELNIQAYRLGKSVVLNSIK